MTIQLGDARDLTSVLDRLLAAKRTKSSGWGFPKLVRVLDRVAKVNPHQHITGSMGERNLLKLLIQVYRQDSQAANAFLDYVEECRFIRPKERARFFDRSEDYLVRWFDRRIPLRLAPRDFEEADDRLNLTRLAFQSPHIDAAGLLREAYRTVALENAAHGVTEVWFRTTLGDHQQGDLARALEGAVAGARLAEMQASDPLRVRFVVGMRKCKPREFEYPERKSCLDEKAVGMVETLGRLCQIDPDVKQAFIGVDSVGMDSDWQPAWQATARSVAADSQLHVAVHFGESWSEGTLIEVLERLEALVRHGVIHQLDNANALFAVKDLKSRSRRYADADWRNIARIQGNIFGLLAKRRIALGINPTSNDWLTRSLRQRDGWRFRELGEPLEQGSASVIDRMFSNDHQSNPLIMVVGNDNSQLYPSRVPESFLTVSEELANLWRAPGSSHFSVYGKLETGIIAQFILNGFALAETASRNRHGSPLQLRFNFDADRALGDDRRVGAHTGFQPLGQDSRAVNGAGKAKGLFPIGAGQRQEVLRE